MKLSVIFLWSCCFTLFMKEIMVKRAGILDGFSGKLGKYSICVFDGVVMINPRMIMSPRDIKVMGKRKKCAKKNLFVDEKTVIGYKNIAFTGLEEKIMILDSYEKSCLFLDCFFNIVNKN